MCVGIYNIYKVYVNPTINMKQGGVFYSLIRPQNSLPISTETKAVGKTVCPPGSEISRSPIIKH